MSEITPTTPLRLAVAASIAFPQGGVTVTSLRLEASRGRLKIERIAGKDFTTLAAIDEMRRLCEVVPLPARTLTPTQTTPSRAQEAFRQVLQLRKAERKAGRAIK